ncbi:hypothetical protein N8467_00915 [bacterium]|nr:hypothetical protein [bacterium]
MNIYTPVLAFLVPVLTPCVCAQETNDAPTKQFALPAGEIKVMDLVDQCATYLNVNILTTSSDCANIQPIRLHKAITTDKDGCEEVLSHLLSRSGFALTVVDAKHGLLEVILIEGRRSREIFARSQVKSIESILARPNLVVPVTTVVALKHIHAMHASNALRPFYARSGRGSTSLQIGNAASNSTLIIDGMQDEVARAIRTIQRCDVEQTSSEESEDLYSRLRDFAKRIKALEKKLRDH